MGNTVKEAVYHVTRPTKRQTQTKDRRASAKIGLLESMNVYERKNNYSLLCTVFPGVPFALQPDNYSYSLPRF